MDREKLFPCCKYSKENTNGVIVQDASAEKALGPGWFDHPADAAAGKVLTDAERAGSAANKAEPTPPQTAAQPAQQPQTAPKG